MTPGLVGGHCIGVDPYYLTYKAETLGYHPQVILAGRRINDNMGKYITEQTIKQMIKYNISIKNNKVLILGFTFKENVSDTRNTKVIDIINELNKYHCTSIIYDPIANQESAKSEYNLTIHKDFSNISNINTVIFAVNHDCFKDITFERFLREVAFLK